MKPEIGIYEKVLTQALHQALQKNDGGDLVQNVKLNSLDDVDEYLVDHLVLCLRRILSDTSDIDKKIEIARAVASELVKRGGLESSEINFENLLLVAISPTLGTNYEKKENRPKISTLDTGLITNRRGESIHEYIESEFASADKIDLLCSFIKLSGLLKFQKAIERHRAQGREFRVLTTTYMQATEAKAIDLLVRLGAKVKISFDETATRLHAKAWIFHRNSGFSTGYVGSSNLSHSAQTDGLEWNVRVSQATQRDLYSRMAETFESYWHDQDCFEEYSGDELQRKRLARALKKSDPEHRLREVEPRWWQKPILRELELFRKTGRNKNLIVMATGTGKTHTAAFDYKTLREQRRADTFLFVAHRKEILVQARDVFRDALGLKTFGELWVDGNRPEDFRHVFASVQSLNNNFTFKAEHFDYVVFDEVHHSAADSYQTILEKINSKQLLGLTATPERADGKQYEKHFPTPYVGNLRIWDAIDQQILVPFRYFVLDTDVDLSGLSWQRGKYRDEELSEKLIDSSDAWLTTTSRALDEYLADKGSLKALAFCVDVNHAKRVADELKARLGLKTEVLTHGSDAAIRDQAKERLASGDLQVLCVVDLFNEGVDIPDVNTLFLYRPTESATIFLQQLGRGLRRSGGKDILSVFDITGRQHPSFRFQRYLETLVEKTPREFAEFVKNGSGALPSGCLVQFEQKSQEDLLRRIQSDIPVTRGGIESALRSFVNRQANLREFLIETGIELGDLYRRDVSFYKLKAEVFPGDFRIPADELETLGNMHRLIATEDWLRLEMYRKFASGGSPEGEVEKRIASMLLCNLFGNFLDGDYLKVFKKWQSSTWVKKEVLELLDVLDQRHDGLLKRELLAGEFPLVMHGIYHPMEICAAMDVRTQTTGLYRDAFYTGVEAVKNGKYDLIFVTLVKPAGIQAHLKYEDFVKDENTFHWKSKSGTRPEDKQGQRHLNPDRHGVTPLLFLRETKKDYRGMTCPYRYLGSVRPLSHSGEMPIGIDWRLEEPLLMDWVRRWRNVA